MLEWDITSSVQLVVITALPILYLYISTSTTSNKRKQTMTFDSPTRGTGQQQCPPPPPSSPMHTSASNQQQHQHEPLPQQRIANLLQYAQSSYTTNPTDALGALMDALTLSTGTNTAAQHAMDRIRSELGDAAADCVALRVGNSASASGGNSSSHQNNTHQQQYSHLNHPLSSASSSSTTTQLTEREMTLRAMAVVEELLNDTSTFLYAQGRQHILQQAMEDGSSVVCQRCGDMISRERWQQHAEYWCREIQEEKSCDSGEDNMKMGDD